MSITEDNEAADVALRIKPFVLRWIAELATGGMGAGGATPGAALTRDQYPDALLTSGERPLVGNLQVAAGRQIDGVDLSEFFATYQTHITDPNAHHQMLSGLRDEAGSLIIGDQTGYLSIVPGPGATLQRLGASTAQIALRLANPSGLTTAGGVLALADTLAGDGLLMSGKVLHVFPGPGLGILGDSIALNPPGVLSVASPSAAAGNHTHAIASSASPGKARSLLATDAGGLLSLWELLLSRSDDLGPAVRIVRGEAAPQHAAIQITAPVSLGYNTGRLIEHRVAGDLHPRAALFTDKLGWGGGTAAPDVWLVRLASQQAAIAGSPTGSEPASLSVAGWLRVGQVSTATPPAPITVQANGPHIRIEHRSRPDLNYFDLSVDGGGNVTFQPQGLLYVNPRGRAVLPTNPYETDLGSIVNKFLTVHAAELRVETLVAQQTLATVGGRILVGPTTTLVEPLSSVATVATVKHNSLVVGDIVLMEGGGAVEFLQVTGSVNNLLRNASFETWDGVGAFQYWIPVGSVIATQTLEDPANARAAIRIS